MRNNSGRYICTLIMIVMMSSCIGITKSPKTSFTDGFYRQSTDNKKKIVYVNIEEDTLRIYNTDGGNKIVDTIPPARFYQNDVDNISIRTSFYQYSFDIDFLTIPLKFRPARKGTPLQLNTNLNGAVYIGYRTDRYHVRYAANPVKKIQRIINHYGFSMGGFTGIGNTAMTPTTTNNAIAIEYDGVVLTKGITGIIAINNFTVGIAIGFDNLLDGNRKSWIYETKPWFGLAFGLNLN